MRELTITHGDACNLSSLRVRGILVISQDRVFLYKETYGNPKDDDALLRQERVHEKRPILCFHLQEGVLELERPGFGFLFGSGLG